MSVRLSTRKEPLVYWIGIRFGILEAVVTGQSFVVIESISYIMISINTNQTTYHNLS
jgi:hypothetical protein